MLRTCLKTVAEHFLNLGKGTDIKIQEGHRVPYRLTQKGTHQDTWQLKWQKLNIERILKAAREKKSVIYKGIPKRLSDDFSAETAGQKGVAWYI